METLGSRGLSDAEGVWGGGGEWAPAPLSHRGGHSGDDFVGVKVPARSDGLVCQFSPHWLSSTCLPSGQAAKALSPFTWEWQGPPSSLLSPSQTPSVPAHPSS